MAYIEPGDTLLMSPGLRSDTNNEGMNAPGAPGPVLRPKDILKPDAVSTSVYKCMGIPNQVTNFIQQTCSM